MLKVLQQSRQRLVEQGREHGGEKKQALRQRLYLSDQEVHVLLHKHIQLSLEDVLHFFLALTAQVGRGLTHSSGNQGIAFVGDLSGQIAGGLVDLSSLKNRPGRPSNPRQEHQPGGPSQLTV